MTTTIELTPDDRYLAANVMRFDEPVTIPKPDRSLARVSKDFALYHLKDPVWSQAPSGGKLIGCWVFDAAAIVNWNGTDGDVVRFYVVENFPVFCSSATAISPAGIGPVPVPVARALGIDCEATMDAVQAREFALRYMVRNERRPLERLTHA